MLNNEIDPWKWISFFLQKQIKENLGVLLPQVCRLFSLNCNVGARGETSGSLRRFFLHPISKARAFAQWFPNFKCSTTYRFVLKNAFDKQEPFWETKRATGWTSIGARTRLSKFKTMSQNSTCSVELWSDVPCQLQRRATAFNVLLRCLALIKKRALNFALNSRPSLKRCLNSVKMTVTHFASCYLVRLGGSGLKKGFLFHHPKVDVTVFLVSSVCWRDRTPVYMPFSLNCTLPSRVPICFLVCDLVHHASLHELVGEINTFWIVLWTLSSNLLEQVFAFFPPAPVIGLSSGKHVVRMLSTRTQVIYTFPVGKLRLLHGCMSVFIR